MKENLSGHTEQGHYRNLARLKVGMLGAVVSQITYNEYLHTVDAPAKRIGLGIAVLVSTGLLWKGISTAVDFLRKYKEVTRQTGASWYSYVIALGMSVAGAYTATRLQAADTFNVNVLTPIIMEGDLDSSRPETMTDH